MDPWTFERLNSRKGRSTEGVWKWTQEKRRDFVLTYLPGDREDLDSEMKGKEKEEPSQWVS